MKKGFIPRKEHKKNIWAKNIHDNIPSLGATLGLTAADIAKMTTACNNISLHLNLVENAKTTYKSVVHAKDVAVKDAENVIRKYTRRMKASDNYEDHMGKQLGIIGEEISIDIHKSKPELKLTKVPSGWRIAYNLHSYFDGINIYKKKSTDADFIFLARDIASPYIDKTSVDIGTYYMAYYVIVDDEVGQASNQAVLKI